MKKTSTAHLLLLILGHSAHAGHVAIRLSGVVVVRMQLQGRMPIRQRGGGGAVGRQRRQAQRRCGSGRRFACVHGRIRLRMEPVR